MESLFTVILEVQNEIYDNIFLSYNNNVKILQFSILVTGCMSMSDYEGCYPVVRNDAR